jgi:hypothetical protein
VLENEGRLDSYQNYCFFNLVAIAIQTVASGLIIEQVIHVWQLGSKSCRAFHRSLTIFDGLKGISVVEALKRRPRL